MAETGDYQPSGEANANTWDWQTIARNYAIESTAQTFGIPEANWHHPTVESFIETTLYSRRLQRSFLHSANQDNELIGNLQPSLFSRYRNAELLTRAVWNILEDGLEDDNSSSLSYYLQGKLGNVTRRFGIDITPLPGTHELETPTPTRVPGSVWDQGEAPQPDVYKRYTRIYGYQNYDRFSRTEPQLTNETEEEKRARTLATLTRLGIPEEQIDHPSIQEYVGAMHSIEDLMHRFDQGEVAPGAPGLFPSVQQRYTSGAHLLIVAKALMEEGLQGRTVDPQFVANHVTSAISPYGVQANLQIEG